jgi:hypothetical protein
MRAYRTVIEQVRPFEELDHLGIQTRVSVAEPSLSEAFVRIRDDAVPFEEYNLLASGRISVREMPKVRHRELTRDHVCSTAIRVARELFGVLPVARTFVHVTTVQLDPATGHTGEHTLLSVEFDRGRLFGSNFDRLDPASAVESFRHSMNFKKSAGLLPVERLEALAQLTSLTPETSGGRRHL